MATKVPIGMKSIASSLQIMNSQAISDRNANTLQDLFNYVVGMTQTQGNANGFTFRGFPNTGSFTPNIQTDGLMGGTLKKGGATAANVERVEFLKGPNSVLYGQMYPGGLLNIATKSPKAKKSTTVRTTISTFAGEFNSFGDVYGVTGSIDTTGPIDQDRKWLYRLIIDGSDDPPFRKGTYDRYFALFPSLTYRWSRQTSLTVKCEFNQNVRRMDDGIFPIFTDGITRGKDARWTQVPHNTVYTDPTDVARDYGEAISLSFRTQFGAENRWTLRGQTRSVWHVDKVHGLTTNNASVYNSPGKVKYAVPGTTLKRQYNDVQNHHRYNMFDTNVYGAVGPESFKNTLLLGVGGGQDYFKNQRYSFGPNVPTAISMYDPILGQDPYPERGAKAQANKNALTNLGVYVSDLVDIRKRLHASFGLRYDQQSSNAYDDWRKLPNGYFNQFVSAMTYQFGLVFDITDTLSGYVATSTSFIPNTVDNQDENGESGFDPEEGEQYEVGLKFENSERTVSASVAAYQIDRSNVLVGLGTNHPITGNAIYRFDGVQRSRGIELEMQWQPLPNWQLQGGGTISEAFIESSFKNPVSVGCDLAGAPRHTATFWTRYNFPSGGLRGLGVGLGVNYVGKQWGGDPASSPYFVIPGWTRADAAIYYKWRRYDIALNIQNLLDKRYISFTQNARYLGVGAERKLTLAIRTSF